MQTDAKSLFSGSSLAFILPYMTYLVHFRALDSRNESLALVNWILAFQNVIIKITAKYY